MCFYAFLQSSNFQNTWVDCDLHAICMQLQLHSLPHVDLLWNAHVEWKGAIPDMIIKMIFNCGEAGSKPTPRSIKPEPRKPLLPLALDMFMFQLHYVKQPPTHSVSVWVPLCKYGCRSVSVCVCLVNRCSSWVDGFTFTFFCWLI